MRAAVYHGVGDIRLEDVPRPQCGPRDILVEVAACGICGTDVSSYDHGSAFANPRDVLGHEFAGLVAEVGPEVSQLAIGDRVAVWPMDPCGECDACSVGDWNLCEHVADGSGGQLRHGGFAEYALVRHARLNRTVYRLPESVSFTSGALVEPMSVALAALLDARIAPSGVVAVMGLGAVGLCVVQGLRAMGISRVVGIDPMRNRRELALSMGAMVAFDPISTDVTTELRIVFGASSFGSARVDAVFECSGVQGAVSSAVQLVRPAGYISLVGIPHDLVRMDVEKICLKEISLRGRNGYRAEYADTIALLEQGRLDLDRLVTHSILLEGILDGFATLRDSEDAIKVIVEP